MKKFTVKSGRLQVSDPCYGLGDGVDIKAKKGEWIAYVEMKDCNSWGNRVKNLVAEYKGEMKGSGLYESHGHICVDSGQAGIFDRAFYKDDSVVSGLSVSDRAICQEEPWFSICCDRTLNDSQWGVIPYGCVSSSGYGDGCYEVNYISDKDGEAVRVEINFIPDEEEESDEDEDED